MAQRVELRSAACPANTQQANAVEVDLSFRRGVVREVEIVLPDGHAGATGLAIAQAHQVVIPASGNVWITGNDEVIHWPLEDFLDTGSWSAFLYNLDPTNAHSWFFRFLVDETGHTPVTVAAAIEAGAIYQAAAADSTRQQTQASRLGAGAGP